MEEAYYTLINYCSGKELATALQNISEDISVVNLPPIPKYDKENPEVTIKSLINTVWILLQQRQQFVDALYNLQQQRQALTQDVNRIKVKEKEIEKRLHDNNESLDKEIKKARLVAVEYSQALNDVTYLKKEVQETTQKTKRIHIQFKHELRRKNNEIAELQSKLRKILRKKVGEKWRGPVENLANFKPADVDKTNHTELVYQKSTQSLENNIHTLIKENLELRKLLDNVSEDLTQLKAQTTMCDCKNPEESDISD